MASAITLNMAVVMRLGDLRAESFGKEFWQIYHVKIPCQNISSQIFVPKVSAQLLNFGSEF